MNRTLSIFKNITILNIILIAVIIFLSSYVLLPNFKSNIRYELPAGEKIFNQKNITIPEIEIPSPSDYTIIAEKNLFHPERQIPVEKKEVDSNSLPQPDFIVYGTVISDDASIAFLEDTKAPWSTPGRGRRQTILRKGDTLSGFTLKEITSDKIVMVKGDESIILYVHDPQRPKVRGEQSKIKVSTSQTKTVPESIRKIISPSKPKSAPTTPLREVDQRVMDIIEKLNKNKR